MQAGDTQQGTDHPALIYSMAPLPELEQPKLTLVRFFSCHEESQCQERERFQQALCARRNILSVPHKAGHNYTAGTPQEVCQIRVDVQCHLLGFFPSCIRCNFSGSPRGEKQNSKNDLGHLQKCKPAAQLQRQCKENSFSRFLLAPLSHWLINGPVFTLVFGLGSPLF